MARFLHSTIVCCVVMTGAGTAVGEPPSATDVLIAGFDALNEPTASQAWKPMPDTARASVVELDGKPVLKLPCQFEGNRADRASWDRSVDLDLSTCRGVQFRFRCPDVTPISALSMYFQSGEGWYSADFSDNIEPLADGWGLVTIDRMGARTEGEPHGWDRVQTIRLSAWHGADKNTVMYVADMRLFGADAPIAVVECQAATTTAPAEAHAARETLRNTIVDLRGLELPFLVFKGANWNRSYLENRSLVILPYAPSTPDNVVADLAAFVQAGGTLIAFFDMPEPLSDVIGIEPATPRNPYAAALPSARTVTGRGAATLVSRGRVGKADGLLSYDGVDRQRLFLAMIEQLAPELAQRAAGRSIERIGQFGPYPDFDEAISSLRSELAGNETALATANEAVTMRDQAIQLLAANKPVEACTAAEQARTLMIDTYCRAQRPLAGEFRAFWCHNAFGVEGLSWDAAIKNLADNGFTAILPNMLWGGLAYYQSDVLPVADAVTKRGDQLAECLAACKKYGIECHVWKVNWNMSRRTPAAFVERMRAAGRTQVMYDGSGHDTWLCPSHPANQQLEIDSMVEVATKYDVDGVHFDYIRYPDHNGCFCPGCRERFEKSIGHAVEHWPADVRDNADLSEQWLAFRRNNITTVVASVAEALRRSRPDVKISAAVFQYWPRVRDTIGQDWKHWCDKGYLDFVCPMDYIAGSTQFEQIAAQQCKWADDVPCYPGIGLSVWPDRRDICKLIVQINITRQLKTGGFTIFNYGVSEASDVVPHCGKGITRPGPNASQTPQ